MESASTSGSVTHPNGSYIESVPYPEICAYPVRTGNAVRPLVDGEAAFTRIYEAVDDAKESVWVVLSFFHLDFAFSRNATKGSVEPQSLFSLLQSAKDRGVDVRALIWRHEQSNPLFKNSWSGKHAMEWLAENNISVYIRWDSSGDDYRCRPLYPSNARSFNFECCGVLCRAGNVTLFVLSFITHRHCHHEKTWIVDAGRVQQVAFCGGIIPSNRWLNSSQHDAPHPGGVGRHDMMLEIRGPSVVDVAHSFVQRWNEAWGRNTWCGSYPEGLGGEEYDLEFEAITWPDNILGRSDGCSVQIQRNLRPMGYVRPLPTVGSPHSFAIRDGEGSIGNQYVKAISSARRFIYIENQHFAHSDTLNALLDAMDRGVEVIAVVPGFVVERWAGRWGGWLARKVLSRVAGSCLRAAVGCMRWAVPSLGLSTAWDEPFLHVLPTLQHHPNFTLVGLVTNTNPSTLREHDDGSLSLEQEELASTAPWTGADIYVHAKLMIVDDCFLTMGSANIVHLSFDKDHTELNASVWDAGVAQSLREQLFREHLCCSSLPPGPKSQYGLFRTVAKLNAARVVQGMVPLGRVHAMDAGMYGSTLYGVATALDISASRL